MQVPVALLLLIAGLASATTPITSFNTTTVELSKTGRCPSKVREASQCPPASADRTDECQTDGQCAGQSKCCTDGCRKVCVMPVLTSCERSRVETVKRARALQLDTNEIALPHCDPVGDYEPVQCDPATGNCYCVDESGFELAGTRARSLSLVNCTNPKPCAGLLCRMLCPYEFELDSEGCPLCQCRDPCRGIKCPGSQTCQLEEMPCAKEPCPPVPTCKQARSADSLCPAGVPLTMPTGDRPFLCGLQVGQPQCPQLFDCVVQPGADYGVCCTAAERLQKAGHCPVAEDAEAQGVCGVPCANDMECQGADKCCPSLTGCTSGGGSHCIPPRNFSLCLQQQKIAQLLSLTEREGKGYVPQCSPDGQHFSARQCSRNGLVCWCVDTQTGTKVKGSMGSSGDVDCDNLSNAMARSSGCSSAVCSNTCDYGYKTDGQGCPTCQCDNPCEQLACPSGDECVMKKDPSCPSCSLMPQCRRIFVPPCAFGRHLVNEATDEPVRCQVDTKFACPSGFHCSYSLPNNASFCCPEASAAKQKVSLEENQEGRLPSICEMMKAIAEGRQSAEPGYSLILKNPRCTPQGEFDEEQCEGEDCWCVDEFGVELAGTRARANQRSAANNCLQLRHDTESECPGLLCRLGCDYGFAVDNATQCPMCECRNPCDVLQCPAGHECQMVLSNCPEAPFCPALPFCTTVQRSREGEQEEEGQEEEETVAVEELGCPVGEPYLNPADNSSVLCNPRSRALSCPDGFSCYSEGNGAEGTCCPIQRDLKAGQCPYLVPVSVDSCDNECSADEDCDGQLKCCSNGCGTQCVEPLIKTACQHTQMIMKYKARENGVPANRLFIPKCRPDDGAFEPVQCDPVTRACWCVSPDGRELAGTRVPPGLQPQCHAPRDCPSLAAECPELDCGQNGHQLDTSGCPVCVCRDPCQGVQCRSEAEECRVVQVNCIRAPCPPLPVCLPRLDNPCSHGQPLRDLANNDTVDCGPMGSSCPSTHKCHLSPLGEFSVCCPKPRDVCFQEKLVGSCKASVLRYSFNEKRNKCEAFRYTGCGGNMNNFESERDCKAVCPSLSGCEALREKNQKMAEKFKKVVFTPKCNRNTGDWEAVQCLEEVGICWCVDKDGEHIKGSLTRGTPTCGVRQSRQRSIDPPICEDPNAVVHMCNKSICESKICLAHPKAVCRVDPCGGCRHAFYDPASGRQVDCQSGLTPCQRELQSVLNSDTWARQGGPWNVQPMVTSMAGSPYHYNLDGYSAPEGDAEMLPDALLSSVTVYSNGRLRKRQVLDKMEEVPASTETATLDQMLADGQAGPSELLAAMLKETESVTEMEAEDETTTIQTDSRAGKLLIGRPVDEGLLDQNVQQEVGNVEELKRPVPALRDAIKPGFCPPVRSRTFLRVLAQFAGGAAVCVDQCVSDADCAGPTRCCPGECGSTCTHPVLLPTPLLPKPGACPVAAHPFGCPDEVSAASECATDADCSGRAKCCSNGCVSTCTPPEENSTGPLMMSLSPPVCTLKGDYAREQSQGEFSWCVDPNGHPIDDSFTRGSVRCSPNGTVLEQRALGPICADPSVQPSVCRDHCLHARCPFHPDALCVADPCDQCRVRFIDQQGRPVECTDRCSQPAETGHCRALFPRYAYNATSRTCQEFIYGGCEGNENNFESVEECRQHCEKPVNVCEMPIEPGMCRASFPRWAYNAATQRCEKFLFGGCGGNANNFHTYQQCANRCPDMVVCPQQSPLGEMSSCSRDEACAAVDECRGYPEATCAVDPCTCTPVFVDSDGTTVECLPPSTPTPSIDMQAEPRNLVVKEDVGTSTTTSTTSTTSTTTSTTTTTTETSTAGQQPRGKSLHHAPHHTRCQKMRQNQLKHGKAGELIPECDHLGRFQPIQCLPAKAGDNGGASAVRCWCVDEAGNQVVNTSHFQRGEQTCRLVPVMAVAMRLGFPPMDHTQQEMEKEVRQQVGEILNGLSARTMETALQVETMKDGTILTFTLVGDNKIDVASHLEDMVKSGHLALEMHGHSMPADSTSSKFFHKLDSSLQQLDSNQQQESIVDRSLETREILAQALDIEAPYLAIIVVLSALASILVCGLIIGLVLHRRRTTGTYPKDSGSTLATPPKPNKRNADKSQDVVVPRGFPRVGINPSDVVQTPQLSPTVPRSKRQTRNAEAW